MALLAAGAVARPAAVDAAGPTGAPAKTKTQSVLVQYPIEVCPISGEKLSKPVIKTIQGREVRFCCPSCVKAFDADTKAGFAKLDSLIIAKEVPHYPLTTCLVSGGKLGEMGPPHDMVFNNHLVRFCCSGCVATFQANTAEYLGKLEGAYAEQAAKPAKADKSAGGGAGK
jgi:transposase-like protein